MFAPPPSADLLGTCSAALLPQPWCNRVRAGRCPQCWGRTDTAQDKCQRTGQRAQAAGAGLLGEQR